MLYYAFFNQCLYHHQVAGRSSSDLQKVSDASEFQENELMNSQERLRSIRAKLAVLEGKVTLAIMYVILFI